MDIDFMKSAAEDQMEMMLMHMEKLSDFSGTYEIPMMEFNNISAMNCNNNNDNNNTSFENQHATFMNPQQHQPSTISFSGGDHPPFLQAENHPSGGGRWKTDEIYADPHRPESVKPPKRRNVKISTDPQSVAARHRRERISERIRILQRLAGGGGIGFPVPMSSGNYFPVGGKGYHQSSNVQQMLD
ncbi:hypothetical protein DH2020_035353 [Rehmannia glutinosa]|uniref:BHLH domain-containing protein n=1 Tax=Rehmannia glutinosa TaxID=99300 RepID=A0ABR0VA36_REHGL